MRYTLIILLTFILCGCPIPGSRLYRPETDPEKELFSKSRKDILPNDIRNHSTAFIGELAHWVGIVDTFYVQTVNDTSVISLIGEQKYWDYVEDFSIQNEHIFLSSEGEGRFLYKRSYPAMTSDSLKLIYSPVANRGNLVMFYGIVEGVVDNMPILRGVGVHFFPKVLYTTKIFQYDIARDSTGRVILDKSGNPKLTNFKVIGYPKAGSNQ